MGVPKQRQVARSRIRRDWVGKADEPLDTEGEGAGSKLGLGRREGTIGRMRSKTGLCLNAAGDMGGGR